MINPIIIIAAVTILLSTFVVSVLNKPKFPLVAASFILVLIFFIAATFFIDAAITDSSSESLRSFVSFLVLADHISREELEHIFQRFMYIDIGLFAASIVVMFVEAMFILRKNTDK